jgi:release factor glutamine methyltransferase
MALAAVSTTYAHLIREAEAVLRGTGVPTPRLDAEVILSACANQELSRLYAGWHEAVEPATAASFRAAVARRRRGEPVAYITGMREFWSLPFAVDRNVLIPRPETELLVEIACHLLSGSEGANVCDVGTGSGCIAVAVAHSLPKATVLALDSSLDALALARRNAARLGVGDRLRFACSDLLAGLSPGSRFDVIASNPPYLRSDEVVSPEVKAEPRAALRAGDDGLDVIRRLIRLAPSRLRPGGALVMEFGFGQTDAVRELAEAAGFAEVSVEPDLAGIPRALVARVER